MNYRIYDDQEEVEVLPTNDVADNGNEPADDSKATTLFKKPEDKEKGKGSPTIKIKVGDSLSSIFTDALNKMYPTFSASVSDVKPDSYMELIKSALPDELIVMGEKDFKKTLEKEIVAEGLDTRNIYLLGDGAVKGMRVYKNVHNLLDVMLLDIKERGK
jgi:hypothetical protein